MLSSVETRKGASEGGFTLIELLVVVVILGILAAVVVFAVSGISDKGTTAACKADWKTIESAEEAYFANQADPASYGSEQELVDGGFLHSLSTKYDVAPTTDGYNITVQDPACPADPFGQASSTTGP